MRIWFDSCLPMPPAYDVACACARTALRLLRTGRVSAISLGYDEATGGTETLAVSMVIESLAAGGAVPRLAWRIQAPDRAGWRAMTRALRLADRHWDDQEPEAAGLAVTPSGRLIAWNPNRASDPVAET
jgi:hypothetical protein